MGLFNSVYIECPFCGEKVEDQFKPGGMYSWDFPDQVDKIPIDLIRSINDNIYHCWNCNGEFQTVVDVIIKVSGAQVIPIKKGSI